MMDISQTRLPGRPLYWLLLFLSLFGFGCLLLAATILLLRGVGVWGVNVPVAWAFAITNFVWWIGLGHAGTFISAILYLVRQDLRTEISRFSETMTVFAVLCAGLFPLLHLGRPWFFYWLTPYPDSMDLWPQFRSPLVWDVFAVGTYLLVSLMFWYMGLIPDLAMLRDRSATKKGGFFYGILAMGWRGSYEQWRHYRSAYALLAALAAPLVISVHSIVGMDFAAALIPGWHSTIYPPFFVAGAIFSGFAMVLTLGIPLRKALGLEKWITEKHFDLCARFTLAMGIIVAYGYISEVFMAFYSGQPTEISLVYERFFGPDAAISWIMVCCNVLLPQILWYGPARRNVGLLFVLSLFINLGMWLERFFIIVISLQHNFLVSSDRVFVPTRWDILLLLGSFGLFFTLYLLFARYFPMVALSEVQKKEMDL